jgi:hypothetical protein
MKSMLAKVRPVCAIALGIAIAGTIALTVPVSAQQTRRFLYVAVPGAGNVTEYKGVGILVFDIDKAHSFVKRIPTGQYPLGSSRSRSVALPPTQARGVSSSAP